VEAPIILATDLAARSDRAFGRAVQLARQWNRHLVIVHVLEGTPEGQELAAQARATEALGALADGLDVSHEVMIATGSLPETIAALADRMSASVIVTGVARYNHVTDFVLGTAVDYLARHSATPILIVKEMIKGPYDGVVVGTDFSERSKEALIEAARLFPELPLKLAHGYPRPFPGRIGLEEARIYGEETANQEMTAFLADQAVAPLRGRIEARYSQTSASMAIDHMASKFRQPLIVLGGRGRGALMHALFGHRASELITVVPHDVLIVRKTVAPDDQ
jgi:nucleotide-binding universal stress UspA family protein